MITDVDASVLLPVIQGAPDSLASWADIDPVSSSLAAIRLATALELRDTYPELVPATHDRRLALAARSMGPSVEGDGAPPSGLPIREVM